MKPLNYMIKKELHCPQCCVMREFELYRTMAALDRYRCLSCGKEYFDNEIFSNPYNQGYTQDANKRKFSREKDIKQELHLFFPKVEIVPAPMDELCDSIDEVIKDIGTWGTEVTKENVTMAYQEGKPDKKFRFTIIAGATTMDALNYRNRKWYDNEAEATNAAEDYFNRKEIKGELVVVEARTIVRPLPKVEVERIKLSGRK